MLYFIISPHRILPSRTQGDRQKMINYFSDNFKIEKSKSSIEKEMICLDQYYHQPKNETAIGSFESFLTEECQFNTAAMSTASFIIILLVCSLLTGVAVFAILNFLWKKCRSRKFEESRSAPRTTRDEEVYIAGQKTWKNSLVKKSPIGQKSHWRSKVVASSNSIDPSNDDENRLEAMTTHCTWILRIKTICTLIKSFYWFIFLITDGLLSREDNHSIINYSDSLQVGKSTKTNLVFYFKKSKQRCTFSVSFISVNPGLHCSHPRISNLSRCIFQDSYSLS